MTIFASYLELTEKFSYYGKRAHLREKIEEMTTFVPYLQFTQKRSLGYYISLNYVISTVSTHNGMKATIFTLSLEVTQKRCLRYHKSPNYAKSDDLRKKDLKQRLALYTLECMRNAALATRKSLSMEKVLKCVKKRADIMFSGQLLVGIDLKMEFSLLLDF